ncbi:MAG: hypothetical protein ACE5GW_03410 [Planctomycetota bacterium]
MKARRSAAVMVWLLLLLPLPGEGAGAAQEPPPKKPAERPASRPATDPRKGAEVGPSRAGPGILWRGSLDEALVEARERNVPLLLFVLADGSPESAGIAAGLFREPAFVELLNEQTVPLIAHGDAGNGAAGHAPIEITEARGGRKLRRCPLYPGIPCAAHRRIDREARARIEVRVAPAALLVDSDLKSIGDGPEPEPPGALRELTVEACRTRIDAAREHLGPKMVPGTIYRFCRVRLERARQSIEEGEIRAGSQELRWVARHLPDFSGPFEEKRYRPLLAAYEREGMRRIARAEKLLERNNSRAARKLLLRVLSEFHGLPTAAEAKRRLEELDGANAGG